MAHINGAYTTYFNTKRDRSGHLFQGRYKAILAEADEYAKELSRYIHLNPVRAGIAEMPQEYEWSSYSCYIGKKKAPEWLCMDFILGYFGRKVSDSQKGYEKFVSILIDKEYESPLKNVFGSTLLGRQEFIGLIKDKYLSAKKADKDLPALKALSRRSTIEDISNQVDMMIKDNSVLSRNIKLYLSQRYTGDKLDDIGRHFGIGGSGVCQAGRRIPDRIKKDKSLAKILKRSKAICQ
jgi:putative transposase